MILIFEKSTKKGITKMKINILVNFQRWDCLVYLAGQLGQAHWQVSENYERLEELWDWCLDEYKDREVKPQTYGVQSQMQTFEYFFGLGLAILLSLGIVVIWVHRYKLKI